MKPLYQQWQYLTGTRKEPVPVAVVNCHIMNSVFWLALLDIIYLRCPWSCRHFSNDEHKHRLGPQSKVTKMILLVHRRIQHSNTKHKYKYAWGAVRTGFSTRCCQSFGDFLFIIGTIKQPCRKSLLWPLLVFWSWLDTLQLLSPHATNAQVTNVTNLKPMIATQMALTITVTKPFSPW